jgi:Transposase DDE domain
MRTRKSTKRRKESASPSRSTTAQRASKSPSSSAQHTRQGRQSAKRSRRDSKRARQSAQRARRKRQAVDLLRRHQELHYELNSNGIQTYTCDLLQKNLRLRDHGLKCSAAMLFTVLLVAAAQCASIAAVCYRLNKAPSDQTIYNALDETLPDYTELEQRINRTLRANLPKNLRRRRQRLAIDLTLIPYHGEPEAEVKEIYRGQAKNGTTHFHAYASLYVVCHGERFTVALIRVELGTAMKDVVQRLLRWAARAGVRPKLLLLDRGFYSVAVIGYLKKARVPFLMPAVARGRRPKEGQPATGIRAFRLLKRGGWAEHTLSSGNRRERVHIAVHAGNYRGQWKRHGRYAWVYAYWGFKPSSPRWVADTYRSRFGIETSYRQMNQGRIKTCTRSPLQRYLYVAIALILRNLWVWLHWEVLSTPRRGRRRLNLERLTLEGMLVCLVHAAEALMGFLELIVTERQLPECLVANNGG